MNYFLDTEFIEKPGSIQLISIGIEAENGDTFYEISSEFDPNTANDWVKENVISKLESEDKKPRLTIVQIKEKLIKFLEKNSELRYYPDSNSFTKVVRYDKGELDRDKEVVGYKSLEDDDIIFWAYYADYDWVVFCWIFGTMMQLPKGIPMYCRDLKQEMDISKFPKELKPHQKKDEEHNALSDAKWNRLLYKTLITNELKKNKDKELDEYKALRDEILIALMNFQKNYNKNNPNSKIEFTLDLHKSRHTNNKEFIAKASVTLILNEGGIKTLLASKTHGFRTEEEFEQEYDWGLRLYREMLYEIVGSGMTLQILTNSSKKD